MIDLTGNRRAGIAWLVGAVLALAATGAVAQQVVETAFLPPPRLLKQHLSRAREAVEEQRYGDAVAELGVLLTGRGSDEQIGDEGEPQDYFIENARDGRVAVSLKAEALRLLGEMPERGRALFELQYGAEAKALLDNAVEQRDVQLLHEVTRRYFHTRAGYEATVLLGRLYFDQGRPLAAALCLDRVWRMSGVAAGFDPELSILLAGAWIQADQRERARIVWNRLDPATLRGGMFVGAERLDTLPGGDQGFAWLEERFQAAGPRVQAERHQWTLYRGDPARNARTIGGIPLRTPRWRTSVASDPIDERVIDSLMSGFQDEDVPGIPALHPLAVGNVVLMRTPQRLIGLDFETGKRIWEYPWWDVPDHDEDLFSETSTEQSRLAKRRAELTQRIWYDVPYGQVASDGEAVYLLADLRHTALNRNLWLGAPMGVRRNPEADQSHNQLVSLDLEREGALNWMVGGETGLVEPKLAGAFFLGPPLPLFGHLYVLAEINGEVRLVVLDSRNGRQVWSQQLAHVENRSIMGDPLRRLSGATPSFADGVLICPTSAGVVVAVDIASRSLLWGYQYLPVAVRRPQFGMVRVFPSQSLSSNGRWLDGTATIAQSSVILTPPDSNELICLDLLTGQPRWPGLDRLGDLGDMLYVACVHQGKIVLVGQHSVTAVSLNDGKMAWDSPLRLDERMREMPCGRGYYGGSSYFLPTSASRLLQIDLDNGKIIDSSPTDGPLGNVICYRDHVIGQSPTGLSVHYQIEPLRRLIAQRLEKNPQDPWAITRRGELLMNDGQIDAALNTFREARRLRPNDPEVSKLLAEAYLLALKQDFPRYRPLRDEMEPLIDDPERRIDYLRTVAAGLQQSGERAAAMDAYVQLIDLLEQEGTHLPSLRETTVEQEPGWTVRLDVWLAARLAELFDSGDPSLDDRFVELVETRRAKLLNGERSVAEMERFLTYFGFHPSADPVRLAAAEAYLKDEQWLRVERTVMPLLERDEADAARATALLARAMMLAGCHDLAANYYTDLKDRFGDVPCEKGQTGEELYRQVRDQGVLEEAFQSLAPWPNGRVKVEQIEQGLTRQDQRRVYPVPFVSDNSWPTLVGSVLFDAGLSGAVLRDREGNSVTTIRLTNGLTFYSQQAGMSRATARGNLLFMQLADQFAAVDLIQASRNEDTALLWRASLTASIAELRGQPPKSVPRRFDNPLVPTKPTEYYLADGEDLPLGNAGPITDHGICYQKMRTLMCVDGVTGEVKWSRSDVSRGAELYGDAEYVVSIGPGQREARVFAAADGRELYRRSVPASSQRWVVAGRYLLWWERAPQEIRLHLEDLVGGQRVWSETVTEGTRGQLVDHRAVALFQPNGRFVLRSLTEDRLIVSATLEEEQDLRAIYVVPSSDQWVLLTSRDFAQPGAINRGLPVPPIRGHLYAFDAKDGKMLWDDSAYVEGYGLLPLQAVESPVLWFVKTSTGPPNASTSPIRSAVLCLDKRTGRLLMERKDLPTSTNYFQVISRRAEHSVTLLLPGMAFTVRCTDEPWGPEPPAHVTEDTADMDVMGQRVGDAAQEFMRALMSGRRADDPFEDRPQGNGQPAGGTPAPAEQRRPDR